MELKLPCQRNGLALLAWQFEHAARSTGCVTSLLDNVEVCRLQLQLEILVQPVVNEPVVTGWGQPGPVFWEISLGMQLVALQLHPKTGLNQTFKP